MWGTYFMIRPCAQSEAEVMRILLFGIGARLLSMSVSGSQMTRLSDIASTTTPIK
jgi:hypothetical protein